MLPGLAAGVAAQRPAAFLTGSVFIGRMLFPRRVAGVFEMVCELFFSICTSFPNDAHLLRAGVLAVHVVSGAA